MQVTIRVTRTMQDGTVCNFEGQADSIQGAIDAADQLATGKGADAPGTDKPATKTETKKPEKKTEEKKPDAATASSQSGATQGTTDQKDAAPAVDYDAVKKGITAVATISRDKAVAMLQRFGVTGGKDLKPMQYADVVDMANKIVAGEYDPLTAEGADSLS